MLVAEFDFDLPESLIAQEARPRGESRLMIVDRASGTWREGRIRDLPDVLAAGDRLVVNDTRVFPARLIGRRHPSGGAVECLLIERVDESHWQALVHPGQKLKISSEVVFEDGARAPGVTIHGTIVDDRFPDAWGRRLIAFTVSGAASFDAAVDALGHVPLPPYIHRADTADDRERYQTIFAHARGSVAAPTSGLHFDERLMAAIAARGIPRTAITLHVGYGTFKPVRVDRIEDHVVDPESYDVSELAAREIAATRAAGGRIVAVGTTTTRALESAAVANGAVRAGAGTAALFIAPGHVFRAVDALVTNFHLPKSSLLMLVAAFAGKDLVLDVYRDAIARGFRFYSYGDAMVVI